MLGTDLRQMRQGPGYRLTDYDDISIGLSVDSWPTGVHPKGLSMFVLLQLYPPEATDHDERDCLDVIAVDGSRAVVEEFLQKYEPRYLAACLEFASWDRDKGADWTIEHERKMEELACKHHVHGALIAETEFRIVESLEVA
jgi:hypothetical protein